MDNVHLRGLVDNLLSTAPPQTAGGQDSAESTLWRVRAATALNFVALARRQEGKSFIELKRPVGSGLGDYPALIVLLEETRHLLENEAS
jgi:hypothetical protein